MRDLRQPPGGSGGTGGRRNMGVVGIRMAAGSVHPGLSHSGCASRAVPHGPTLNTSTPLAGLLL